MLKNYLHRARKKAFLGAALAIGSAVAGMYGASKQKKAQEEQYALQRMNEARNVGYQSAANLTKAFANADELDKEFQNRFFLYGGRKKANFGTELITGLANIVGNNASAIVGPAVQKGFVPTALNPIINNDKNDVSYDSAARSNFLNNYYRTVALRLGGSKRCR